MKQPTMNSITNLESALRLVKQSYEEEIRLLKTIQDLKSQLELNRSVNDGLNIRIDGLQEHNYILQERVTLLEDKSGDLEVGNRALRQALIETHTSNLFLEEEREALTLEVKELKLELKEIEAERPEFISDMARISEKSAEDSHTDDSGFFENECVIESEPKLSADIRRLHSTSTLPATKKTPLKRYSEVIQQKASGFESINTKTHEFKSISSKLDNCDVCGTRIAFKKPTLKCCECHMKIHASCRLQASSPCFNRQKNMKAANRNELKIEDFVPAARKTPKIPFPIVQCVAALEKKGLTQEGLYRKPGNEAGAKKLFNELTSSRPFPKIDLNAPTTLTGCLKKFLNNFSEPIIPLYGLSAFLKATRNDDAAALKAAVKNLPEANRDTLAYLCCHLQRVAGKEESNKMNVESLARCVGPSIVAISTHKKPAEAADNAIQVTKKLLQLPASCWLMFLDGLHA